MNQTPEPPMPVPPPQVVYAPPPPQYVPPPQPTYTPPPPPAPKAEVKAEKFSVQVANCIYKECVDDYRFLLKHYGYSVQVEKVSEISPMTEIISMNTLGEEMASNWVKQINEENQLTGNAFRKKTGNEYKISLGLFPDLDTANRVKAHLNQIYASRIAFEAKRAEQRIRAHKVRAGGFDSRKEAVEFQQKLKKRDKRFEGSFVITYLD